MARPAKKTRKDGLCEIKRTVTYYDGVRKRESFYSPVSKADAERKYNARQHEVDVNKIRSDGRVCGQPVTRPTRGLTVAEMAESWLTVYKQGQVRNNTYETSSASPVRNHIIPYFKGRLAEDVTSEDIKRFFLIKAQPRGRAEDGVSRSLLNKLRYALICMYDEVVYNGQCPRNPARRVKLPACKSRKERPTYTQQQRDTVLKYAMLHPLGASVYLMLKTGITRSELLGLCPDDLDATLRQLSICRGITESKNPVTGKYELTQANPKTEYRARVLPIDQETVGVIQAIPLVIPVGGNKRKHVLPTPTRVKYLIHDSKGNAMRPGNWYKRVYQPFMASMHANYPDIPVLTPHELRHTFATLAHDNGVDLLDLIKLMGHADEKMLAKLYAHTNIDTIRKALGYA